MIRRRFFLWSRREASHLAAPMTQRRYVEPAHEALIRSWGRIREWQQEQPDAVSLQRAVWQATEDQAGHQGGLWNSDPRLRSIEQLWRIEKYWLAAKESRFVHLSVRRRRLISALGIGLAAVTVMAAIIFYRQRQDAVRMRDRSLIQALAGQAPREQAIGEDERAALLARQAFLFYTRSNNLDLEETVFSSLRAVMQTPYFSKVLTAHDRLANAVAFSANGHWMASGGQDGKVLIWDTAYWEKTALMFHPTTEPITTLAFHPKTSELVAGTQKGNLFIWDLRRPAAVPRTLHAARDVRRLVVSPGGEWLAAGSSDRFLRVWSWQNLARPPQKFDCSARSVDSIAFDPKQPRVFSGDDQGEILIWDLQHPMQPAQFAGNPGGGSILSLALNPDASQLVTGDLSGAVRLWDLHRPKFPSRLLTQEDIYISCVALSPNGEQIAACNASGKVMLWELKQVKEPVFAQQLDNDGTQFLAFSPNGKMLTTANTNGSLRLWELQRANPFARQLNERQPGPAYSVAISSRGSVATTRFRGNVLVWRKNGHDFLPAIVSPFFSYSIAFRPGHDELAVLGNEATTLWNPQPPQTVRKIPYGGMSFGFSPDGVRLAISDPQHVRLVECDHPDRSPVTLTDDDADFRTSPLAASGQLTPAPLAFHPKRSLLAVGYDNGVIRLWNWQTPEVRPTVIVHTNADWKVLSGAKRPPRRPPVSEETVDLNAPVPKTASVMALIFSADGKFLLVGRDDGTIERWTVEPLLAGTRTAPHAWQAHSRKVRSLALSPDGQTVASGSDEGTIRLWNLGSPSAKSVSTLNGDVPLMTLGRRGVAVYSLVFTPDETQLVSGDYQGVVTLWTVSAQSMADDICSAVHRDLTKDEWKQYVGEGIPYEGTCSANDSTATPKFRR